jgi:hypothetical protein
MRPHADAGMSLYGPTGARKYLNAAERRRFTKAANCADPETRLFCLVLIKARAYIGRHGADRWSEIFGRSRDCERPQGNHQQSKGASQPPRRFNCRHPASP